MDEKYTKFEQLGLNKKLLNNIKDLGFLIPTRVQSEVIPAVFNNEDILVMSKTGSGKTAAFGLPIVQKLIGSNKLKALVLTPTRELALQVEKDIRTFSVGTGVKSIAVYGKHNINTELKELQEGVNIVVGTPGRVFDHVDNGGFSTKDIDILVLDEADRMLDMGFIDQVIKIIKRIPSGRVTMCFSATLPYEVRDISMQYMNEPITVELDSDTMTVDSIKQIYIKLDKDKKRKSLGKLIDYYSPDSCMVFCNTRDEVDRVTRVLKAQGFYCDNLHGANTQRSREKAINSLKNKKVQVMVATDVAARGIHIEDLEMVINHDVPDDKNSYVHRVGRTGRAGKSGLALNLVTSDTIMTLYEIEEHVGTLIEEVEMPTDAEIAEKIRNSKSKWKKKRPVQKHLDSKDQKYKKTKKEYPLKKKRVGTTKTLHKNVEFKKKKTMPSKKNLEQRIETRYVKGIGKVDFIVKKRKKKSFFSWLFGEK